MARHLLMAMTNPVNGREDEFNDWYSRQHMHDVMKAPGIESAQRFVLGDLQRDKGPYPFRYLALYDIEADDIGPTIDYLDRHAGTAVLVGSKALADEPRVRVVCLTHITPRATKPAAEGASQPQARNLLVAMTNAVEGRDSEFNEWYTRQHLPDVVNAPGIIAAQRFALADKQRHAGPYDFSYVAIYEIGSDSVQGVIDYIGEVAGTPAMPISDALSAEPRVRGAYFRPITPRLTRNLKSE